MFIQLQDVSYKYPAVGVDDGSERKGWALRHIDLEIEQGELVAMIGQNGSGKSTLSLLFNGLIPHFFRGDLRGTITVDGVDTQAATVAELITTVGVLFQNPFDQLTGVTESVHEEVAFGAENLGLPREETLRRVSGALKSAGIEHLADRHPYALSGGQQQRVAFASVLVMQPRVLVLDEPTSQLDPIGSDEVFEVIRKLHSEGYTIVLAEHKVEALAELATRVIVLDEGKLVMDGSPRDVLGNRQLGLHRVLPPVYTRLSEELAKRGLWEPETPPLTIGEAAEIVKGILVGDS